MVLLSRSMLVTAFASLIFAIAAADEMQRPAAFDDSFNELAILHNNLGITQALNGQFDLATMSLDSARLLVGDDPALLNNLANILLCEGRFSEAIAYYNQSIQIDSLDHHKLFNLGLALHLSGSTEKAEQVMGRFIESYDNDSSASDFIPWLPNEELLKGETQAASTAEVKRLMNKARERMKWALVRKNTSDKLVKPDSSAVTIKDNSPPNRRTVPAGGKAVESKDVSPLLYWIFK